ncbi:H/ACA ribonucleoprotein complex subunit GAR1-like [Papaver somniferum]|uniref:H/ACA ribonucleoprotein complex subunit GAR1-like n=1 Tax=Papaver somniferum TaxID=3469 RepID=UPI000E6F72E8|nr:H/ACA ribonucleoprotein complex subunit GAR1-like [Papaver somniferum]
MGDLGPKHRFVLLGYQSSWDARVCAAKISLGGAKMKRKKSLRYVAKPCLELQGNLVYEIVNMPRKINMVRLKEKFEDSNRKTASGEVERVNWVVKDMTHMINSGEKLMVSEQRLLRNRVKGIIIPKKEGLYSYEEDRPSRGKRARSPTYSDDSDTSSCEQVQSNQGKGGRGGRGGGKKGKKGGRGRGRGEKGGRAGTSARGGSGGGKKNSNSR